MNIDVISDLHLDFWVDFQHTEKKQKKLLSEMLSYMLPKEPSKVLLIAGDLGHRNLQNSFFLELLKEKYEYVLWVFGNHDLYLIGERMNKKFASHSMNRLAEMEVFASEVGAIQLNGNIVTIDGVKFTGAGGFYDGQYAVKEWSFNPDKIPALWKKVMSDAELIKDNGAPFDFLAQSAIEKTKLSSAVGIADVIVTHVPPEWDHIPSQYRYPESTFWHFDGYDLMKKAGKGKTWLYGHVHDRNFYTNEYGLTMVSAPLGYPNEYSQNPRDQLRRRGIVTIEHKTNWDESNE